ncbi:transglycosylase domain-containing protein [Geodermatophilus sp. YIM 151500]|uniref:transglycosylase domain-containing protein n=1 Tax=Geodermatophilus sp. YIM 151500 TaxID=2984531 RepID=UPI0021E461F6|nr:transglycosylase domain-containing protein [Geodermatophilus sp. YIM 151500]MCV2488211.1 transglycosylase domain-containing protein [Geodermatophilus sp. YIM 151500]
MTHVPPGRSTGPYGYGPPSDPPTRVFPPAGPAGEPYPPGPPYPPGAGQPPAYPEPEERRHRRFGRRGRGIDVEERPPRRRRRRGLLRRVAKLLVLVLVVQALVVLSLRWITPPTTAFMWANPAGAVYEFVAVEHVSRNFLAAVIAHEDQQMPYREGAFEWEQLRDRATAHLAGQEDPHGSTIPQQLAKNLFLNSEMSAWRKAVEAGLSVEVAAMLDDRRVLELYVNYAQLGPNLYGICAASWYYFDTPPSTLLPEQAVQLVGLLPSPGHVQRAPGGGLDFEVDDGLGWLSRSHVINAQNRVPRHLAERGFQPVEDAGIPGLAADQPPSDDDCSARPDEVAELVAAQGTA